MPPNEKKEPNSRPISIRLPREIYEKAVAAAEADNRSLSNYILHILVKSVEEGETISHEIRELRNAILHQQHDQLPLEFEEGPIFAHTREESATRKEAEDSSTYQAEKGKK